MQCADFLGEYKNLEAPAPLVVSEEDAEAAEQTIEAFFAAVQGALGLGNLTIEELFERTKNPEDPITTESEQRLKPESVEIFRKRGGQVLASVLRIQQDDHTQAIRFYKHTMTDETEQIIHDLQYLERIHTT